MLFSLLLGKDTAEEFPKMAVDKDELKSESVKNKEPELLAIEGTEGGVRQEEELGGGARSMKEEDISIDRNMNNDNKKLETTPNEKEIVCCELTKGNSLPDVEQQRDHNDNIPQMTPPISSPVPSSSCASSIAPTTPSSLDVPRSQSDSISPASNQDLESVHSSSCEVDVSVAAVGGEGPPPPSGGTTPPPSKSTVGNPVKDPKSTAIGGHPILTLDLSVAANSATIDSPETKPESVFVPKDYIPPHHPIIFEGEGEIS